MSINQRIRKIMEVKAGGSLNRFANALQISQPYASKLVTEGGSAGIDPITKILKMFPDIDARWLILGEGEMIDATAIRQITFDLHENIRQMLSIEQYIPYMTDEEIKMYKDAANGLQAPTFTNKQIDHWKKISNGR